MSKIVFLHDFFVINFDSNSVSEVQVTSTYTCILNIIKEILFKKEGKYVLQINFKQTLKNSHKESNFLLYPVQNTVHGVHITQRSWWN